MEDQIKKAIQISRLNVDPKKFKKDIKEVIEMFNEIKEVDVSGIPLNILPIKVKNQMRKDLSYKDINKKTTYQKLKRDFNPDKEKLSIGPKLK